MLFNSVDFLIFFPLVTVAFFVMPKKLRNLFLLLASLYFYMSWKKSYLILICFSIVVTYLGGVLIQYCTERLQNKMLACCVLLLSGGANLSVLFLFKYFDFFVININELFSSSIPLLQLLLPVGISFFTFQTLGYIIDVYYNNVKCEKNLLTYALFVSFYPQLVAGPIERSDNLLQQVKTPKEFSYDNMRRGLLLMGYGFFQKLVIADRLSLFANSVYSNSATADGAYLLVATIAFAIQIYCDFASYSNIAIGAARVMGYSLMENFKAPYFSKSVSEFWSRWHISLSAWFQDYLFNPIVWASKDPKKAVFGAVIVVFLVSGFWHGASWTFVAWGALHAVYRVLGIVLRSPKKKLYRKLHINTKSRLFHLLQVCTTFLLVCFTYIFFRAESMAQALSIISKIFTQTNFATLFSQTFFSFGLDSADFVVAILALGVLLVADILIYKGVEVYQHITQKNRLSRWCVYWGILFAVLIFGVYGPSYDAAPFIYFQF